MAPDSSFCRLPSSSPQVLHEIAAFVDSRLVAPKYFMKQPAQPLLELEVYLAKCRRPGCHSGFGEDAARLECRGLFLSVGFGVHGSVSWAPCGECWFAAHLEISQYRLPLFPFICPFSFRDSQPGPTILS